MGGGVAMAGAARHKNRHGHMQAYVRSIPRLPPGNRGGPNLPSVPTASPARIIISATSCRLALSHWDRRWMVTRGERTSRSGSGTSTCEGRGGPQLVVQVAA